MRQMRCSTSTGVCRACATSLVNRPWDSRLAASGGQLGRSGDPPRSWSLAAAIWLASATGYARRQSVQRLAGHQGAEGWRGVDAGRSGRPPSGRCPIIDVIGVGAGAWAAKSCRSSALGEQQQLRPHRQLAQFVRDEHAGCPSFRAQIAGHDVGMRTAGDLGQRVFARTRCSRRLPVRLPPGWCRSFRRRRCCGGGDRRRAWRDNFRPANCALGLVNPKFVGMRSPGVGPGCPPWLQGWSCGAGWG